MKMAMDKPQVIFSGGCFLSGFQDCRQQGCCRQGYREVFTPCLEGQIGKNLQIVNRHFDELLFVLGVKQRRWL